MSERVTELVHSAEGSGVPVYKDRAGFERLIDEAVCERQIADEVLVWIVPDAHTQMLELLREHRSVGWSRPDRRTASKRLHR
mgnify:CR=1 FL=1